MRLLSSLDSERLRKSSQQMRTGAKGRKHAAATKFFAILRFVAFLVTLCFLSSVELAYSQNCGIYSVGENFILFDWQGVDGNSPGHEHNRYPIEL